jgi:hypothetical protein
MKHRKLGFVLLALAAAAAGCTLNGKPLFQFGAKSSMSSPGGGGGSGTSSSGSGTSSSGTSSNSGSSSSHVSAQAPASYAWCKDVIEESSFADVKRALDPDVEPYFAIPAILQALCHPDPDVRVDRNALEGARRAWMQRLLLDERDWATDIVAWGNLRYSDRMAMLLHDVGAHDDVAWSKTGPMDQWVHLRSGGSYALYLADAFPLTEAGRLGLVEHCISPGRDDEPHPADWAICQPDLEAIDLGKLGAEIRGETSRKLADRMTIRLVLAKVQRHLPAHAAKVKQLVGKDPVYAKLFEIARTARKEWSTVASSRAEALAAVRELEDGLVTGSRKALDGCATRTWPAFTRTVAKVPAERFKNLRPRTSSDETFFRVAADVLVDDLDVSLALTALYLCEGGNDRLVSRLAAHTSSELRGPRTAAVTAIRRAGLVPDKRGEKIAIPRVSLPLKPIARSPQQDVRGKSHTGIIAAVTERGDTVRITFPTSSEIREQCASSRRTNRISSIDSGGNVHYESVCTKHERVRVDTTPDPIDIAKRHAAGLAPKRYVMIFDGVPEAVWATAKSPAPLAAFGVLLK